MYGRASPRAPRPGTLPFTGLIFGWKVVVATTLVFAHKLGPASADAQAPGLASHLWQTGRRAPGPIDTRSEAAARDRTIPRIHVSGGSVVGVAESHEEVRLHATLLRL